MTTGQPIGDLLELDEDMLATLREVHETQWTRPEHFQAGIFDALGLLAYRVMWAPHINPKKWHEKPPPPIDRPGVQRRRGTTLGELKRMMQGKSDG